MGPLSWERQTTNLGQKALLPSVYFKHLISMNFHKHFFALLVRTNHREYVEFDPVFDVEVSGLASGLASGEYMTLGIGER